MSRQYHGRRIFHLAETPGSAPSARSNAFADGMTASTACIYAILTSQMSQTPIATPPPMRSTTTRTTGVGSHCTRPA